MEGDLGALYPRETTERIQREERENNEGRKRDESEERGKKERGHKKERGKEKGRKSEGRARKANTEDNVVAIPAQFSIMGSVF